MKLIVLALLAFGLSACATPYGKYGIAGGYTDSRIDENTFSIRVEANGFTSQETASQHAMYRAAELTAENGFDYFIIVRGADNASNGAMVLPTVSSSQGTISSTGQVRTSTVTSPAIVMPIAYPNSALVIKSFKGSKPDGQVSAYDARSVMKYLGPQIGLK